MADKQIDVRITATTDQLNRGILTANTALKGLQQQLAASGSSGAAQGFKDIEEAANGVQHATAGVTREFIVLGHEAISGNLSRIPGSLVVLAERMGGLQLATVGWAAAVVAAGAVLYELVSGAESTAEALDTIDNRLALTGRSFLQNDDFSRKLMSTLSELPGVTKAAAASMAADLAGSARISSDQMIALTENVGKYAQLTGEAIPKAMKDLEAAIENPFSAYKKLDDQYNILSDSQKKQILNFEETNDRIDAGNILLEALEKRLEGIQVKMTPLQTASRGLKTAWDELMQSFGVTSSIEWLDDVGLPRFIDGLKTALQYLQYIYTAKPGETFTQFKQYIKDAEQVKNIPMKNGGRSGFFDDATRGKENSGIDEKRKKDAEKKPRGGAVQNDESEKRRLYEQDYQLKKQMDDLKVESGEITRREEITDLMNQLKEEETEVDASYQRQLALYREDSVQYKKVLAEKAVADKKFQIDHIKLTQELTKEDNKQWVASVNTVQRAFSQMASGLIRGTTTIRGAFLNLANSLVTSMADATLKMAFDWIKKQGMEVAATAAGDQAKIASKTAATAEGKAIDDAASSSEIMKDASKAAAGAYSAIAGIPYVGPILAPIAAGVAFAAVAAFDSFDVGTPYVPSTGLAMVHEGEKIVPKGVAKKWDDGELNKLGGGGGVHLHVHALDHQDVKRYLNRNSSMIAKAVGGSIRNGNRSFAR